MNNKHIDRDTAYQKIHTVAEGIDKLCELHKQYHDIINVRFRIHDNLKDIKSYIDSTADTQPTTPSKLDASYQIKIETKYQNALKAIADEAHTILTTEGIQPETGFAVMNIEKVVKAWQ